MGGARATFNGVVVAEADSFESVDGNVYFPPSSLKEEFFSPTTHTTTCGWKGTSNYYNVSAGGKTAENAAWFYASPKDAAKNIKDHVAFYTSKVKVERL